MTITLTPEIEAGLTAKAQTQGTTPERLALERLRKEFAAENVIVNLREPRDEWERILQTASSPCGVSLSNEAVSSEGIYE